MGSRRPATARSTLLQRFDMKLLSELLSLSSWNSTTGSLELGKKDFHTQYLVKEQLGKGGFGVVYSAVRRSDGLEVAVKEVNKDERVVVGDNNMPLEVALMQQLQDVPGVIRFIDYFDMQTCFYIVMERFHSKDLFDFISEQGPLPEALAKDIFRQLLTTLVSCHQKGVVHRDIKDENILIDLNTLKIKLIDFGSGCFLEGRVYREFQGTRVYSPPEGQLQGLQARGSDHLVPGSLPLRHGLRRRPLRVRRSDLQGPPHLVPPVEAQRGGEELDQRLSQGQPPPEVEHPPGRRPPLAPRQDHPWQPGDQEHQEHGTPLPSNREEPSILLFVSIVNLVSLLVRLVIRLTVLPVIKRKLVFIKYLW